MADSSLPNGGFTGLTPADIEHARKLVGRGLSLVHLGCNLATDVVDVVGRMHGTISRVPGPFSRLRNDAAFGIAGFIYRLIRGSFDNLSQGFAEAGRVLDQPAAPSDANWLHFQAALNGVFGDRLARDNSPLALGMSLHRNFEAADAHSHPVRHQVIFLHGLCMSELGWHNPAHQALCERLRAQAGTDVAYLRYNTGRHISSNGEDLSALLESTLSADQQLTLIGHSMGGLLIRSALHAAEVAGHRWPSRLKQAAMLGSPHHGAPLERIGNWANRLLKISPYMTPLAHLGEMRSAGIRDLRFGSLTRGDWSALPQDDHAGDVRLPLPLPAGPRYLLVAASVSPNLPDDVARARHDYLVPVASALGLSSDDNWRLDAPALQRETLAATHHMQLLDDPEVYRRLQTWLLPV